MKASGSRWILAALAPAFHIQSVTCLELSPRWSCEVSRRGAIVSAASVCSSLVVGHPNSATADDENVVGASFGFRAYSVIPDASAALKPEIVSIEVRRLRGLGLKLVVVQVPTTGRTACTVILTIFLIGLAWLGLAFIYQHG
jgi:hypothetical protein